MNRTKRLTVAKARKWVVRRVVGQIGSFLLTIPDTQNHFRHSLTYFEAESGDADRLVKHGVYWCFRRNLPPVKRGFESPSLRQLNKMLDFTGFPHLLSILPRCS